MRNIEITIKKELRAIVRDKKSLFMMALTPFFIPLFVFLLTYVYDTMLKENKDIYDIGVNYTLNEIEKEIVKDINLNIKTYDNETKLKEAYKKEKIKAYIVKEDNNYKVYNNNGSEEGSFIEMYITSYLESYKNYLGNIYLSENNIDPNLVYNNITYSIEELEGSSLFANEVLNMAIIFTIMAITLTAIYSATDLTAGEKERGTLETLLTYPIKSSELILGKYLAIVISSILTLIISMILLVVSLTIVNNNFDIFKDITFNLNIKTISLSILILITYSLFISGLCIAIASKSKTFKEAQSSLTPVSLIICLPMFMQLLNIKLNGYLNLIPILNHSFILSDIFLNKINKVNIFLTIISSIIYALILIYIIIKQYKSEKILFDIS